MAVSMNQDINETFRYMCHPPVSNRAVSEDAEWRVQAVRGAMSQADVRYVDAYSVIAATEWDGE